MKIRYASLITVLVVAGLISSCDKDAPKTQDKFSYHNDPDSFSKSFVSQATRDYANPNWQVAGITILLTCDRKHGAGQHANLTMGINTFTTSGHGSSNYGVSHAEMKLDNAEPIDVIPLVVWSNDESTKPNSDDIASSHDMGTWRFNLKTKVPSAEMDTAKNMIVRAELGESWAISGRIDAPISLADPAIKHVLSDCGYQARR